jgi:hypothetical protein
MSNYPNMSYCQCENTLLALQQVLNSMEEDGVEFLQGIRSQERRAYQELYGACRAFMRRAEAIEQELIEQEQA